MSHAKSKNGVEWTDLVQPTAKEKAQIKLDFPNLHEADLKDAFRSTFRSQIVGRKDYVFMVIVIPVFQPETHTIFIDEVDVFIGKDWVLTIHDDTLPVLREFRESVENDKQLRDSLLSENCAPFAASLLHNVIDRTYPMTDHIDQELEEIKNHIYQETRDRRVLVKEILRVRQNITDIRKAVRGYATMFQHLNGAQQTGDLPVFINSKLFEGLVKDATDIWEALDSNKEEVESLQQANESLITHNLNEIFKTLTGISTLGLPAVVIAGIFGMNTRFGPILLHPYDFWVIICLIAASTAALFLYFAKKHWLK